LKTLITERNGKAEGKLQNKLSSLKEFEKKSLAIIICSVLEEPEQI
jgi:hypothetical protein